MNISAQLFKNIACKRLIKRIPSAFPVMAKVITDDQLQSIKEKWYDYKEIANSLNEEQ